MDHIDYFHGIIESAFICLLIYFIYNQLIKRTQQRIEKIVSGISEHLYDKNEFYREIVNLGLKRVILPWNTSKTDDGYILVFYDKVKSGFDMKRKKLEYNFTDILQYNVRSIYVGFYFSNDDIQDIHICFNNLNEYKFISYYVARKIRDLIKNNKTYLNEKKIKFPSIHYNNYYNIFIGYSYSTLSPVSNNGTGDRSWEGQVLRLLLPEGPPPSAQP